MDQNIWTSHVCFHDLFSYDTISTAVIVLLPAIPIAITPIFGGLYLCGWKREQLMKLINNEPLVSIKEAKQNMKRVVSCTLNLEKNAEPQETSEIK